MPQHPIDHPHYRPHHSAQEWADRETLRRNTECDRLKAILASGPVTLWEASEQALLTYERGKLLMRWDRDGRPPVRRGGRPSV